MNATFNATCPPAQVIWAPAQIVLGTSSIMPVCDLPKTPSPISPPKGGLWAGDGKVSITARLGMSLNRDLPKTYPNSKTLTVAPESTQTKGRVAYVAGCWKGNPALDAILMRLPCHASATRGQTSERLLAFRSERGHPPPG